MNRCTADIGRWRPGRRLEGVGPGRTGDLASGECGHAARGCLEVAPVQASVAPVPGWVLMERVTDAVEVVTVLPPLSSTVTTGWVVQATPLLPPPGWVVKTSWVAGPTVMVRLFEVALVRP